MKSISLEDTAKRNIVRHPAKLSIILVSTKLSEKLSYEEFSSPNKQF